MTKLSGKDIDKLSQVLLDTLSENDLQTMVYSSTGDQLYEQYVGPEGPMLPKIKNLLIELQKIGSESLFLGEVYQRRPGRPDVRAEIERLRPEAAKPLASGGSSLSVQRAGVVQDNEPVDAFAPGFQRNVRPHLTKLDVRIWGKKLTQIERQVCRIEYGGNAAGTGFLVGPDAVLTNWHVVETAKTAGRLNDLACRFDYLRLEDNSRQLGNAIVLHADGLIDSSSYSPAEKTRTPGDPPPTAEELDYALLRLAETAGLQNVEGSPRGWVALPSAKIVLAAGAPLIIVQHPDGAPMKLALDTDSVIGRNANGTRLLYKTNTDPGSSGSPCFSMDWDLVALHHYGDPAWQDPLYNQGVPIELIQKRIVAKGLGKMLDVQEVVKD
jgi:hypothetical protein